jgi:type IV pilus assembly protein PilN
MRRINLLPWREARRKHKQRELGILAIVTVIMSLAIVAGVHMYFDSQISHQTARNDFLRSEIARQKQVENEIKTLERTKAQILSRMEIIQNLQSSRPEMVHVFDEMVRVLPEEVYLVNMRRSGDSLTVNGVARDNKLVSDFMRNLASSQWFGVPVLQEVNNREVMGVRASFFEFRVAKRRQGSNGEGTSS